MTANMPSANDSRKVALLLNSLGLDLAESALVNLNDGQATQVRQQLKAFSEQPPSQELINQTLDDFEAFMRFALETAGVPDSWASRHLDDDEDSRTSGEPRPPRQEPKLKVFEPTNDPVYDLGLLMPAQIAGALDGEHALTIGIVLSVLEKSQFTEVISLLDEEKQPAAFFASQQPTQVPEELLTRIVRTTIEKAILIEPSETASKDLDQKTAEMLRALPKGTRKRLLEELEKTEPERTARLQDLMYVFEDIVIYDNRSIQKMLGQFDTQMLVTALQDAESEITDRIFENLSKRASATLKEEMEFKQPSSEDEVMAARDQISKLIAQMDRNEELTEL